MNKIIILALFGLLIGNVAHSQTQIQAQNPPQSIEVKGTSTLHDWKMKVNQAVGKVEVVENNGVLEKINSVSFLVPVSALKSDESLMNKKAYEALNSEKFPNMTFVSKEITLVSSGKESQWLFRATGNLTISGTTKKITVSGNIKKLADGRFEVTSIVNLKMTDFNVVPPTMFFGSLKTGDEIFVNIDQFYK